MSPFQAAAVLTLWRSGSFDTKDIADLLTVTEANVAKVIHAARERERGPDLHMVKA